MPCNRHVSKCMSYLFSHFRSAQLVVSLSIFMLLEESYPHFVLEDVANIFNHRCFLRLRRCLFISRNVETDQHSEPTIPNVVECSLVSSTKDIVRFNIVSFDEGRYLFVFRYIFRSFVIVVIVTIRCSVCFLLERIFLSLLFHRNVCQR